MNIVRKGTEGRNWFYDKECNVYVFSDRYGLVDNIDTSAIKEILSDFEDSISSVFLNVEIGDPFPEFERFDDGFRGLLCVIELKRIDSSGMPLPPEQLGQSRQGIQSLSDDLDQCFDINRKSYLWLVQPFAEMIEIFRYRIMSGDLSLARITKKISEGLDKKLPKDSELRNSAVRYFIISLFDKLPAPLNEEQVQATLDLVYGLKALALVSNDLRILRTFLDVLNNNLYSLMTRQTYYSKVVATHMLYLEETAFSWSTIKSLDDKEIVITEENWKTFYEPLFRLAIDKAFEAIYIIAKFGYTRSEKEIEIYLEHNLSQMIDLLTDVSHTKHLEEHTNQRRLLTDYLGDHLIYVSIYLFRCIQEGFYSGNFFAEFVVPVANNCTNANHYARPAEDLLDETFYSADFSHQLGGLVSEVFQGNKIHNAGAYSPQFYSTSIYWIAISVYRKLHGQSFIPTKKGEPGVSAPPIGFQEILKTTEINQIAKFLQGEFNSNEIGAALNDYRSYVKEILK